MNYNIAFKVIGKNLYVDKVQKRIVDEEKLNNTNMITTDDLVFSLSYARKNFDILVNFLNLIILKYNVKTIVVKTTEMDLIYLDILKNFKKIEKIIFLDDVTIGSDIFLRLNQFTNVQKIECYEMSSYLIERLDVNKNIKVLTRHKISKKNIFLTDNHLDSYTDFYYKKQIFIDEDMTKDIVNDIDNFMAINTRLKEVKIIKYSNEAVITVLDSMVKHNKKNVQITINEKNNDLNEIFQIIAYIKKQYKKYIETNKITFKLNYSNEYKLKNFIKEINLKILFAIILIVLIIISIFTALNTYQQFEDQEEIQNQMKDINSIINSSSTLTIDDNVQDIDFISSDEFNPVVKRKSNYVSPYYVNYSHAIDELVKINSDTVGWLSVNNTKINYPVVQNRDSNSYYLNRDFRRNKNSMGWIFMDYRNDPVNFDKNTIIYGHNIKTGIMFGTLKYTLSASWYKNTKNHLITFNTSAGEMNWKIFSIYRTNVTNDYLQNNFESTEEYQGFLDMISSRSVYNFNTPVSTNDNILTLSSCVGSSQRVVIHAVLVKNETPEVQTENTENIENTETQQN